MHRLRLIFRLPALPIALAAAALFGPMLLSGRAMFWGTPALQFVPWWNWAWGTLLDGHLPLWNPLLGMGAPLAANYQSALFYPPNWIYLGLYPLGGAPAIAWGQGLMTALHLAWAGLGMAALARRLGLGVLAQAVSGLAFGFCGYLVARAGFLSISAAAAWLPWVLLGVTPTASLDEGRRRGELRAFLGLAACLALQLLAGHAQTTWYTLLLAGVWSAFWALRNAHSHNGQGQNTHKTPLWKRLAWAWGRLALAGLLAFGMAGVQLLPTAEYLAQSQRSAAVDFEMAMTYSFWPWRLLGLVVPDMFGSPVQGDYWGYANYWEDAIYVGMLPFLLALGMGLRLTGRIAAGLARRIVPASWRRALAGLWERRPVVKMAGGKGARAGERGDGGHGNQAPSKGVRDEPVGDGRAVERPGRGVEEAGRTPYAPTEGVGAVERLEGMGKDGWLPYFLMGLFALALVLGLGQNTPVFPWLYRHVPTFSMFNAPTRFMIWGAFALALLAGLGAERWRCPQGRGLYWTRLGSAGAFAVSLGAGLAWFFMGDISPSFIRATALAGVWGLGSGLLSLLAPPRQPDPDQDVQAAARRHCLWQWGVALFVGLDLCVAGWGLNPAVSLDLYRPQPGGEALREKLDGQRLYLSSGDEYRLKFERFFLFASFDPGEDWLGLRGAFLPNISMLDGFASANNFDPLLPGRYARWMNCLGASDPGLWTACRQAPDPLSYHSCLAQTDALRGEACGLPLDAAGRERLLALMDVGLVEKASLPPPYTLDFEPSAGGERLRWTPCAVQSPDEQAAWEQALGSEIDFERWVVLEDQPTVPPAACDPAAVGQAVLLAETPAALRIQVQAETAGWLVVADTWYPGWRARVDGSPADVLRANYLFRAVAIPAGVHEVELVYQPLSFWAGLAVSLLGWVVFGWLAWKGRRGRG